VVLVDVEVEDAASVVSVIDAAVDEEVELESNLLDDEFISPVVGEITSVIDDDIIEFGSFCCTTVDNSEVSVVWAIFDDVSTGDGLSTSVTKNSTCIQRYAYVVQNVFTWNLWCRALLHAISFPRRGRMTYRCFRFTLLTISCRRGTFWIENLSRCYLSSSFLLFGPFRLFWRSFRTKLVAWVITRSS